MIPKIPQNGEPRNPSSRGEGHSDVDDLIASARQYFAADFPKPLEEACPEIAEIDSAAWSGSPSDELRAHLFRCSPCFTTYNEALVSRRNERAAAAGVSFGARLKGFWSSLRLAMIPVAALTSIVIVVGALFYVTRPSTAPQGVMDRAEVPNTPQPDVSPEKPKDESLTKVATPEPSTDEARQAQPAARASREPHVPSREYLAANTVRVDLGGRPLLRDESVPASADEPIKLAKARQRLELSLPETSPDGQYEVAVVDAFGKPLRASRGRSRSGVLPVVLDLRGVKEGRYRLRVARAAEAPEHYPVLVTTRPPNK